LESLKGLNERFGGLFKQESETDEEPDEPISKGFSRWGWLITLDNLTDGDATKWNHYYGLNVIEFLTIVSYFKSKADEQERIREIEKLKNMNK
jgi:hypothetical protein